MRIDNRMATSIKVIVPGGLNTDIIGLGVERLLGQGELTLGGTLRIGPGGKARNMAQMAAAYLGKNQVAMIGRTAQDPLGLWKIPLESLRRAGVNTAFVKKLSASQAGGKYPGIALIPVDKNGKNQIYVLPGINRDFCRRDIDRAAPLFQSPTVKVLLLALEIPLVTAQYAVELAHRHGIKVVLDPGGIRSSIGSLLRKNIFLLKPNEHEARILSGITIQDLASAQRAARSIMRHGVENILITHGAKGAYFFTGTTGCHIPAPRLKHGALRDETGCGDQVTAILAACLAEGKGLAEAARLAVRAGTMQFYRSGIQPITKKELLNG